MQLIRQRLLYCVDDVTCHILSPACICNIYGTVGRSIADVYDRSAIFTKVYIEAMDRPTVLHIIYCMVSVQQASLSECEGQKGDAIIMHLLLNDLLHVCTRICVCQICISCITFCLSVMIFTYMYIVWWLRNHREVKHYTGIPLSDIDLSAKMVSFRKYVYVHRDARLCTVPGVKGLRGGCFTKNPMFWIKFKNQFKKHIVTSISSLTFWLSVIVNYGPPRLQQVLQLLWPLPILSASVQLTNFLPHSTNGYMSLALSKNVIPILKPRLTCSTWRDACVSAFETVQSFQTFHPQLRTFALRSLVWLEQWSGVSWDLQHRYSRETPPSNTVIMCVIAVRNVLRIGTIIKMQKQLCRLYICSIEC